MPSCSGCPLAAVESAMASEVICFFRHGERGEQRERSRSHLGQLRDKRSRYRFGNAAFRSLLFAFASLRQNTERFANQEPVPAPLDAALSEMDSTAFAMLASLTMTERRRVKIARFAQDEGLEGAWRALFIVISAVSATVGRAILGPKRGVSRPRRRDQMVYASLRR